MRWAALALLVASLGAARAGNSTVCLTPNATALDALWDSYDAFVGAFVWAPAVFNSQLNATEREAASEAYAPLLQADLVNHALTLHGFWPSTTAPQQPADCPGPAFQPQCMDDRVLEQSNYYFPDVFTNTSQFQANSSSRSTDLWVHEWGKHGTCAGLPQREYFIDAAIISATYNISRVLQSAGIVPSVNATYRVADIRAAIEKSLGPGVLQPGAGLLCSTSGAGGVALPQLQEVRVCINKSSLWPLSNCSATLPLRRESSSSCGSGMQRVRWLPLSYNATEDEEDSGGGLDAGAVAGIAVGALAGAVLVAAAVYLGLIRTGVLGALFAPRSLRIVHNPQVHQPVEVLCEEVDLEAIAAVDPDIAAVAGQLGYGLGIKGGVARKVLQILYGQPEPAGRDFDIDVILLAEEGLTEEQATELRKDVSGMRMGHLVLEPKDVEVEPKGNLFEYFVTRDICLNEVLLLRLAPGAPLTLFYTADARFDARNRTIRAIPHALRTDMQENWLLDGDKPIISPGRLSRLLLRYFKLGAQSSYQLDEASWAYYRRVKMNPVLLWRTLRPLHAKDERYRFAVEHLMDVGLLSRDEVRRKGGANGLWGHVLKDLNDKLAQFGGRLTLDEPDADAVEKWIVSKKARMHGLPETLRERASRTGYFPADEATIEMGLVAFPPQLRAFVDAPGGLWDAGDPHGAARAGEGITGGGGGGGGGGGEADAGSAPAPAPAPLKRAPSRAASRTAFGSVAESADSAPLRWVDSAFVLEQLHASTGGVLARLRRHLGTLAPVAEVDGAAERLEQQQQAEAPKAAGRGKAPGSDVRLITSAAVEGATPAAATRLGEAWATHEVAEGGMALLGKEEQGGEAASADDGGTKRTASRHSVGATVLFVLHVAASAWQLLVAMVLLTVAGAGLLLYQLSVQSKILNAATSGDEAGFRSKIYLLTGLVLGAVVVDYLSQVTLQLYTRRAMRSLYVDIFSHVIFQDSTFYTQISTSELVSRTAVDMMSVRLLLGSLIQKLTQGVTLLVGGVVLLALYAGDTLQHGGGAVIGAALGGALVEGVAAALVVRAAHRVARSAMGRFYGFSYSIFSSIECVQALSLQRSLVGSYEMLAGGYFQAALVLQVWVASHEAFLAAVFRAMMPVSLLYIGGNALLNATLKVGSVYAMMRYSGVIERALMQLSGAVARFFATYGSLERVIDLQMRGQLTHLGKPPELEAVENEEEGGKGKGSASTPRSSASSLAKLSHTPSGDGASGDADVEAGGDGTPRPAPRLTLASWTGGVRCHDVILTYRGRPGSVLFRCNLELQPGQAVVVSGGTACGRTSLLHLLHLDLAASGGGVEFGGAGGAWLRFHPTSADRYDLQQRMGWASPGACAVFFASVQENMVCACRGAPPSVSEVREAAALCGLDRDVATLPDGLSTLVGEASRVDMAPSARLRLGLARLLLLGAPAPRLVLVDDADRFLVASPRFGEVVARLRAAGAAVVMTAHSAGVAQLRAGLAADVGWLELADGQLAPLADG